MTAKAMHLIPSSPLVDALRALYGTASALNDFIDQHIESLKASKDSTIERVGRVLEGAKQGFELGYSAPIAVVAIGQLLLGNPLSAVASAATMAVSPVAITCAAVGAIWMGWQALTSEERDRILETVKTGLGLSVDVLRAVVAFVIAQSRALFNKPQVAVLKELIRTEASAFGRSLAQVTGSMVEAVRERLPRKQPIPRGDEQSLTEVLWCMDRAELELLLRETFGRQRNLDAMELPDLRQLVRKSFSDAAAYSWPWASSPSYLETMGIVAQQLKLPVSNTVDVKDLERAILFKVVELALEKLDEKQKSELVDRVGVELKARGVAGKMSFSELLAFVKTGGIDLGMTVGGLALAGPGLYGVVGLNFLQFVVLKGIVFSSGYLAAGSALLGMGSGGLALAIAGWAGPVGAGLAFLYTAHSIAGPAFRKLVPAVCVIAAKRLEASVENAAPGVANVQAPQA